LDQPLTHEEVMKTAKEAENKFVRLVKKSNIRLGGIKYG